MSEKMNEGQVREAEAVLIDGIREFTYPRLGKVVVKFPTIKDNAEFNRFYMKEFTRLLKEDVLLTYKAMKELLEKKGDWTEKDDQRLMDLQTWYNSKTISLEEINLKKRKSKNDKEYLENLKKEIDEIYTEYIEKTMLKYALFENTVENQADAATLYYKMVKLVFREDGVTPVWNTPEEFEAIYAIPEIDQLEADCKTFWRGVDIPLFESSLVQENGNEDTE